MFPDKAVGVGVVAEGFGEDFGAVAGLLREHVVGVADADRVGEVFVEVVDVFGDAVFEGSGNAKIVEGGKVLHILAEPDTAGVRANRDIEFCGHEDDGEVLVDSGETATIDLADINGVGLQKLFEHDPVVAVLTSGDANSGFAPDAGVTEDVVGAGWLFHPPGIDLGKGAGAVDGFLDVPLLVSVHHELVFRADFGAHEAGATEVVRE